ncbi:hypothetical protein ZHAS_00006273 [Anopheles sinensis]|uniref:Uncharacterized protein n=1 Tax=Anopheles sinensis TaxID=74873 RepID=A0A084VLV4_ANOSI|nr:hypothetical protein ZHAS_00006273 [Anopheles sinensis]
MAVAVKNRCTYDVRHRELPQNRHEEYEKKCRSLIYMLNYAFGTSDGTAYALVVLPGGNPEMDCAADPALNYAQV